MDCGCSLAWIKLLVVKAIHDKVKRTTRSRRLAIRKEVLEVETWKMSRKVDVKTRSDRMGGKG